MLNRDLRLGLRDWPWTVGGDGIAPQPSQLEITGWPPEVVSDVFLEPANDNLVITGHAPVAGVSQFIAPGADSLTVTGYAPTPVVDQVPAPGADALVVTGYAPTISGVSPTTVTPDNDTLVVTGYAPTPRIDEVVFPAQDDLVVTGYAPTPALSEVVTPGNDTLTITEYAPTIETGNIDVTVTPANDTLVITGAAPSVSNDIPVGNDTLVITEYAPQVSTDERIAPGADALVITEYAPTIAISQVVTPANDTLVITEYAPNVRIDEVLFPGADSLAITEYAPTVVVSETVAPGADTLTITEYAPTVATGGGSTTHSTVYTNVNYQAFGSSTDDFIANTSINEGDLIVIHGFDRSGNSYSGYSISDTNSGTWTLFTGSGYDNALGDSNARHASWVWYRLATSTDASSGVTISVSRGNNAAFGFMTLTYRPDSGTYNYAGLGTPGTQGTGAYPNDMRDPANTLATTSAVSGSNLFVLSLAVGRMATLTRFNIATDVGFANATEDWDDQDNNTSNSGTWSWSHRDNQSASSSTFSDSYDSSGAGIEGTVTVLVFEDSP